MCLQWCHVTRQIIDNDYPCVHCDPDKRFGKAREDCATCRHVRGENCALSAMPIPQERTCCHHDVEATPQGRLELGMAHVHPSVLQSHRARDLMDLFWMVESAPEAQPIGQGMIAVQLEELAVPFVYGVPASEWE